MKTTNLLIGLSTFALATHVQAKKDNPPNIIYIIMDDLGYGDIGCYGQEKSKHPISTCCIKTGCTSPSITVVRRYLPPHAVY